MRDWDAYYEALAGRPVRELLSRGLRHLGPTPPGRALDLGCGDGTETRRLLTAGWHVVAVDMEPDAESRILAGVPDELRGRLEVVIADLATVQLPPAELIYAGLSLFFVEPARFPQVWAAIRAALRPEGVLAVNLMGVNDSWAREGCTVLRRDEIDQLCEGLEVLELTERDQDGTSFAGPKHWHLYDLIARQPLTGPPLSGDTQEVGLVRVEGIGVDVHQRTGRPGCRRATCASSVRGMSAVARTSARAAASTDALAVMTGQRPPSSPEWLTRVCSLVPREPDASLGIDGAIRGCAFLT